MTTTPIGVGSNPLQGLLICGQLLTSTSTSRAARHATRSPGAEIPSTMPIVPSASTGTFMYQLMLLTRSRLPSPHFDAFDQEVLDAGVLVLRVVAVAQRVRLLAARTADGVVAAAGVVDDLEQRACPRSTAARMPVVRKMLRCAAIVVCAQ